MQTSSPFFLIFVKWYLSNLFKLLIQSQVMKKNLSLILFLSIISLNTFAQKTKTSIRIPLEKGEKVWTGLIRQAHLMPFKAGFKFDFYGNNDGNQIQPLILTNKGRYVWSEEPYAFEVKANELIISNIHAAIKTEKYGKTLPEVQRYVSKKYFPTSGNAPDSLLFSKPQFNTWIELTYNQNQADVLNYAHAIVDNGFPAGVLMIDASWQEDYGYWRFHSGKFPNPKAMMDELHAMGFKVMLWVCPMVSPDQAVIVRELMEKKAFLMDKRKPSDTWATATEPAMIKWWDGYSAQLDFTNPAAVKWFSDQMDLLQKNYGVDGFKFDAGDATHYPDFALPKVPSNPNRMVELYAKIGLKYPLNEYRACWKMAGQPLAQRLSDKGHNWGDAKQLVPHMLVEGLVGYTFSCPDMIGGGEFTTFLNNATIDQELVVRSAQTHALMPMMQFSVAPWRVLDAEHLAAVKKAVSLRAKFTPLIMKLMRESAQTGEPIIKHLEFVFPNQGFENVSDQFMLGNEILVAPVQEKGQMTRNVILPTGRWKAEEGTIYEGGKIINVAAPLNNIPYFEKVM